MRYIDTREDIIKEYFNILAPDYPEWLDEYIETDVMLKQQYISVSCGKIYAKMFNLKHDYSSLDHSIAVALIIWHFTHDKKQTLSGLFHDIATPAFKHCVDFLNGDWMNQESTEDETTYMIKNSDEIMHLLERDNIKLEEVNDYHLYPIADNDTPHLSADRLEYSLSNSFLVYGIDSIDSIKEMYRDIEVQKDENNITELGFKSQRLAERFVRNTSYLSVSYRDDGTRFYMQLVADILKRLSDDGLITKADLYNMKETEVINLILNSKYGNIYKTAIEIDKVNTSKEEPVDCYNVHHGAKIRYIDPLVNGERISDSSIIVNQMIKDNLSYKMDDYLYIDRSFNILNDSKTIALIVAKSKNNVIGKEGTIPWNIKGEQKQFKELTTNNTIIMGRKTYEDIGHPLPNRLNIVVSRTTNYEGDNLITVDSLENALKLSTDKAYVIGGYSLFKEALDLVDRMYITEVDMNVDNGDVFFPEFNEEDFDKELIEEQEMFNRYLYTKKLTKNNLE